MGDQEHIKKLPNAPLQEVIFELLWEIESDSQGKPFDPKFEFAQGIFAKEVSKNFPVRRRTMPEGSPIKIYPKAIHQFWKNENEWPVLQIGPGILAINDTESNYEWENKFYPVIKMGINILEDSYEQNLNYIKTSLRYIDAVELGDEKDSEKILDFINKNFKIKITNEDSDSLGSPSNVSISQTFKVNEDTKLHFIISDGKKGLDKLAVIWQTHIFSNQMRDKQQVLDWLSYAHDITSNTFKNTITKNFYDSFL